MLPGMQRFVGLPSRLRFDERDAAASTAPPVRVRRQHRTSVLDRPLSLAPCDRFCGRVFPTVAVFL